ncbi:MAG: L-2-amino-thiazoline-4-carboxylic acid hydrolase [Dethiobacter sp.]|jgi:hypothetical protein|nr:L-2-amino-thiazoline-4-carboxylic acid hydrolase [Dethiobacter sp.]
MTEFITKEEAKNQVVLMAKRFAMVYGAFAEVLLREYGEERAKELITLAIKSYGDKCGETVREGVTKLGLEHSLANYFKVPDLPELGWELQSETPEEGELKIDVSYCPLAEHWKSNEMAVLGRLYCYVDQAKFSSYNPNIECLHTKNVLDGDKGCTILVRKKIE